MNATKRSVSPLLCLVTFVPVVSRAPVVNPYQAGQTGSRLPGAGKNKSTFRILFNFEFFRLPASGHWPLFSSLIKQGKTVASSRLPVES